MLRLSRQTETQSLYKKRPRACRRRFAVRGLARLTEMSDLVLSVGIISVDGAKYAQRRAEQRQTWVGIGHRDSRVFARFVLRCGTWRMSEAYPESNYTVSASILQENATFGDVVCTDVPENAGRLKGPSLIMLAWLRHALSQRSLRSRFIAVVDDDAYIQLADMLKLIQGLPRKVCRL